MNHRPQPNLQRPLRTPGSLLFSTILLLLVSGAVGRAQPVIEWATTSNGASTGIPNVLAISPGKELYVIGRFDLDSTFRPQTVLQKFDLQGNRIGSQASRGAELVDIAFDAQGNYHVTGRVWDAERLGTGVVNDLYLGKYSPAGKLIWERSLGAVGDLGVRSRIAGGKGVAIDRDGNIYVAGDSTGPAVFGDVTFPDTAGGPLLCKFSPGGSVIWARRLEGPAGKVLGDGGTATSIAVDTGGNVVFTGYLYNGTTDFWGTTVTISGPYASNSFIAKILPNGDVAWVVPNFAFASIAVDRQSNIYFNGYPAGVSAMRCGKLNPRGEPVWQRTIQNAFGGGVALDGNEEPIFWGEFQGTVSLDGHVLRSAPNTEQKGFICKASAGGKFQWAVGDTGQAMSRVNNASCDGSGNIYLTGWIRCVWRDGWQCEPGELGSFSLLPLPDGEMDLFIARISDPTPVPVELTLGRTDFGLALSWPATATGFVLESADALPGSAWSTVATAPVVDAGQNVVTVEAGGDAKFYRLRKP